VIKNSVDALEGGARGVLDVSINQIPSVDMLRLAISDNGPGIESELIDSVFEPFVTTKSSGKGTGLGLAMCRRTMQENGGNIRIESHDASGTRIVIEIPTETTGQSVPG
jgi:C4-dicarboxylate-specific signal transduction histidine kinase